MSLDLVGVVDSWGVSAGGFMVDGFVGCGGAPGAPVAGFLQTRKKERG